MSLAFSSQTRLSPPDLTASRVSVAFLTELKRLTGIHANPQRAAAANRRRAALEIARLPPILQQDIAPGIDPTHENL